MFKGVDFINLALDKPAKCSCKRDNESSIKDEDIEYLRIRLASQEGLFSTELVH
jgi:hypothetical protein